MPKKKTYKKKKGTQTVGEPVVSYEGKEITFFKSLEEENLNTHQSYADLSPEECLAIVTRMRLAIHPSLNTDINPWGKTIYFD
jgi:hypothetical protein